MEAVRAFRVIFPDSEEQLVKLAQDLVMKLVSLSTIGSFFIYCALNLDNIHTYFIVC